MGVHGTHDRRRVMLSTRGEPACALRNAAMYFGESVHGQRGSQHALCVNCLRRGRRKRARSAMEGEMSASGEPSVHGFVWGTTPAGKEQSDRERLDVGECERRGRRGLWLPAAELSHGIFPIR